MAAFKEYKREFTDEEMVLHAWDKEMIQNLVSRFTFYWGNGETERAIRELWVHEPEHIGDASFATNTGFYVVLSEVYRHLVEEPKQLADEVLVMQAGRCVEYGQAAQLFDAPGHACTRHLVRTRLALWRGFRQALGDR